ncbi:amidohydrolase family protein [Candidatus Hodarchaeum mangrovi]
MKFDLENPLLFLKSSENPIWDSHVHIWSADAFSELERWGEVYGVKKFMGIASPEIKKNLEREEKADKIKFGYYLPINAFAEHNTKVLLTAVEEAHTLGYSIAKMWFGPRFLDYTNAKQPFSIDSSSFEPVFALLEDLNIPIDCHVADPDIWYEKKYLDEKYRSKKRAISEFANVLSLHSKLKVISVHFGSLPEPNNHSFLGELLDKFPNLMIDTASTKWIVRELGRDLESSWEFILKYQDRILFATDLSVGWSNQDRPIDYIPTRYWTQRLFWETNYQQVKLPFSDEDNQNSQTLINGLNIPEKINEKIYWKNAQKFFNSK